MNIIVEQNLHTLENLIENNDSLEDKTLIFNITTYDKEEDDFVGLVQSLTTRHELEDNILEYCITKCADTVLVFDDDDVFSISPFGLLCIWYSYSRKFYKFTRGNATTLVNLEQLPNDKQAFLTDFGDIVRALKYACASGGADGLRCRTLKVKYSKDAIGEVGAFIGGVITNQDRANIDELNLAEERKKFEAEVDTLQLTLETTRQEKSDLERELGKIAELNQRALESKQSELETIKTQLTSERTQNTYKNTEIENLKKEIATLKDKGEEDEVNSEISNKGVGTYRTLQTQNISGVTVKHILYFKELSQIMGVSTLIDVFINKLKKNSISYKLIILDDSAFIKDKYGNIPIYTYKDYVENKGIALNKNEVVLNSRVISPVEDYLHTETDIMIVYDRLRAEADVLSGGIVSRFIIANGTTDVTRARQHLGVSSYETIICPSESTPIKTGLGCIEIPVSAKIIANKGKNNSKSVAREVIISSLASDINGEKEKLISYLGKLCGVEI